MGPFFGKDLEILFEVSLYLYGNTIIKQIFSLGNDLL